VNDVDGVYVEVHIDCWLDVGHQQIWRGWVALGPEFHFGGSSLWIAFLTFVTPRNT